MLTQNDDYTHAHIHHHAKVQPRIVHHNENLVSEERGNCFARRPNLVQVTQPRA